MIRVLAFDPGPGETAWAYIEGAEKHHTLNYGKIPSEPRKLREIFTEHPAELIAVEIMGGFPPNAAAWKGLQSTATISGIVIGLAYPTPTFTLPANAPGKGDSWRYRLTGVTRAQDHDVQNWLEIVLPDLPRTNNHVRDAAGLGVVALRSSKHFFAVANAHPQVTR